MSEENNKKPLLKALFKFQGIVKSPVKDAMNTHYDSDYVTLDGLLEVVKPALNDCELILTQVFKELNGKRYLITSITHIDGCRIESELELLPEKNTNQALGSSMTYMRRYAIEAICGIAGTNDDDGNASSIVANKKQNNFKVTTPSDAQKGFYNKLLKSKYPNGIPFDVIGTAKNMSSFDMSGEINRLKKEQGYD